MAEAPDRTAAKSSAAPLMGLGWVIAVGLSSFDTFGLVLVFVAMTGFLISLVLFLFSRRAAGRWFLVAVAAMAALVASGPILRWQRAETTRAAQPLIDALAAYQTDNGCNPTSLSDLTPRYIQRVPRPWMRWGVDSFRYDPRPDDGATSSPGYRLWFDAAAWHRAEFVSERARWVYFD